MIHPDLRYLITAKIQKKSEVGNIEVNDKNNFEEKAKTQEVDKTKKLKIA